MAAQKAQTHRLLFLAWSEAAKELRRLRSDPAEARCIAARAAFYQAVYGYVPPVRREER